MIRSCPRSVTTLCVFTALLASAPSSTLAEPRRVDPAAYAAFCVGVQSMVEQDHAEALSWFQKALERDPKSADCHIWIGVIHGERLHQPRKAREHFEQALKLFPGSFRARYGIAKQLLRAGQHREATKQMLLAIHSPEAKTNPALAAKAYSDLAVSAELRGDWKRATEYYAKAADTAPNPVYALVRLAHLYQAIGKNEEALAAFLKVKHHVPTYAKIYRELCDQYKALGKWGKALDELQAYMKHRNGPGEQDDLLKEAADLAEKAGRLETARSLHEKLLLKLVRQYTPEAAAPNVCEDIASALEELGRPREAEPYLRKAVEAADEHAKPPLRMKLALIYERLGLFDKAVDQLNACLEAVEPKASIPYRAQLCAALEAAEKYDEARKALETILKVPGSQDIGHAELGLFYSRRGNLDKAVQHLHQAIKLADARHSVRYRVHLSVVYADAGRHEKAEQALLEAQKMFPGNPSINNALGWLYAEQGVNLDKALALVLSALKAHPQNPYYLDSLGWIYFKQGRKEAALQQLLRAAALARDSVIWDHLGDVYMALGRPAKARTYWKRSLEFDAKTKGVREKLEKLTHSE